MRVRYHLLCAALLVGPSLLVVLAIVAWITGCQTPAILDPHVQPGQCNQYTEHVCAGGGCCPLDWDCGGVQWSNEPAICPAGMCCDANFPPDPPGARHHTKTKRGAPCSCIDMGVDIVDGSWHEADAGYWTGTGRQYVRDCYTGRDCP